MSEINTLAPLDLFQKVAALIEESRKRVATAVNTAMVYTYFVVGRYIVEEEQQGNNRAEYGKSVLKELSKKLTKKYGSGWSYANLTQMRSFSGIFSEITDSV